MSYLIDVFLIKEETVFETYQFKLAETNWKRLLRWMNFDFLKKIKIHPSRKDGSWKLNRLLRTSQRRNKRRN